MSRIDRKKQDNQQKQNPSDSEISKIYYIVIGLLLLILVGLVIFIFNRSGDNVNLNDGDNQTDGSEQVEPTEPDNNSDSDGTDNSDEVEVPDDNEPETPDNTEDNSNNDDESSEDMPDNSGSNNADSEQIGETVIVNNEAPHDSDHAVEYAAGSSDRIAIKNRIIEVTGLDNNLIEWWIGNDGPGRVKATVSNRESTIYYDVYLQFGEGNWHVTRYQRISGN